MIKQELIDHLVKTVKENHKTVRFGYFKNNDLEEYADQWLQGYMQMYSELTIKMVMDEISKTK